MALKLSHFEISVLCKRDMYFYCILIVVHILYKEYFQKLRNLLDLCFE